MRIAMLVPDNREIERNYAPDRPYFGTAPTGLFEGFGALAEGIQNSKSKIQNPAAPADGAAEIHVISCTQRPMTSPEKLAGNIWFHSLHVPKIGWLRTGYQGCIRSIGRKLREIQPDLVHAQGTERDCALAAVFTPYPKLLTIHGNLRLIRNVLKPKPWSALALQAHLEGFAVPRFDGVICITNYTRRFVENEVPRTWVVPNAADPRFFADTPANREPDQTAATPPAILVVANVDARKNQNAFIRALDPLAKSLPFRVKFFGRNGGGDYGAEFERLVADRPWCEFGGMIGREALRDEFAQAAAIALPTHEDNCPMAVLEAQAARVPVMASHVGGVPDLVADGVTGLLTDPNDPPSMRIAIERLLTDPGLVRRLVENGHRQALEKFHPIAVARRHLEIYREVGALG